MSHRLENGLHLGKRAATDDHRDIKLADVVAKTPAGALPKAPKHIDGIGHAVYSWPMLGNGPDDTVFPGFQGAGDCTIAGAMHETAGWLASASGPAAAFTGREAIADYSVLSGFDPHTGANDTGLDVRDVLKYRRTTGVVDVEGNRHKIGAFVALEPGNVEHLAVALLLFDAVGIGIQFPSSATSQFDKGHEWTVVRGAQVEGGHYIPIADRVGDDWPVITWAKEQRMSLGFYEKYCDEAWAILSPEQLNNQGVSAHGLNYDALNSYLQEL